MIDNDMGHKRVLKRYLIAFGLVLAYSTVMAVIWGTAYFEARVEYGERFKEKRAQEAVEREKIREDTSLSEEDRKGALVALEEKIAKEREEQEHSYLYPSWIGETRLQLTFWWSWVVLAPLLFFLWERFRFTRTTWIASGVIHLVSGLVFGTVRSFSEFYAAKLLFDMEFIKIGVGQVLEGCVHYLTFLLVYNALAMYRRHREREIKTSHLEAQLTQAQLDVLKMQLHPHFLFNSLHAISTLMHRDLEAAETMLSRLSELLRLSLDNMGQHEIPLRHEIDFLKRYLDIEQIRFGDRLEVKTEIDGRVLDGLVPNLILQPLVENAINHGVSKITSTGRIHINANMNGTSLVIEISDNGPGLPEGDLSILSRTGINNTCARISQLYGDAGIVEFKRNGEAGLTVRLSMPFHVEGTEKSDEKIENPYR